MTPEQLEELRKKLGEMGIKPDQWREAGGTTAVPPTIERQKKLLVQAQKLLEQQLEDDKNKVAELQERLNRLKHGGGV